MKLLLLIFLAGLVTRSYAFTQNEDDIIGKIGYAQFFIIENIILMAGDNCSTENSSEIRKAKTEAVKCIGDLAVSGSFCDSLVNDWLNCLNPLGKKLEKCNENVVVQGAIDVSIRTTISQAEFICKSQTADLFELVNPCLLEALESEEPCVNKFVMDVQSVFLKQTKLTDEFCRAASVLESCLTCAIQDSCSNNVTINTIRGMYNATVKPCVNRLH